MVDGGKGEWARYGRKGRARLVQSSAVQCSRQKASAVPGIRPARTAEGGGAGEDVMRAARGEEPASRWMGRGGVGRPQARERGREGARGLFLPAAGSQHAGEGQRCKQEVQQRTAPRADVQQPGYAARTGIGQGRMSDSCEAVLSRGVGDVGWAKSGGEGRTDGAAGAGQRNVHGRERSAGRWW